MVAEPKQPLDPKNGKGQEPDIPYQKAHTFV